MVLRDALPGVVIQGSARVRYYLKELLGEGGQGWVYKAAYDDPEGFPVVVKVLRPECVHGESLTRFTREAEVLRRLGTVPNPNPNIVRFYDYAVFPSPSPIGPREIPFIAIEYVPGHTLADVIRAHGGYGLAVARVRNIMRQVARALDAVHEHRIVHRDLKPSNVLIAPRAGEEVVKVTDFGLVKLPSLAAKQTLTVAGASLGYAPPEQYEMGNARVGPQTDVFSFAAVLFQMLSGNEAFPMMPNDTPLRVVARMLQGERGTLRMAHATSARELRMRADVTASIDREINRALSADPTLRHESIRSFWEIVEPLLDEAASRLRALKESGPFRPIQSLPLSVPAPMPAWQLVCPALENDRLHAAIIDANGRSVVGVGSAGLYECSQGRWLKMSLPPSVLPGAVRGILRMFDGKVLIFGDSGLAMTLSRSGAAERLPLRDPDFTVLGAATDEQGTLLVGERPSQRVGVLMVLPRAGAPLVVEVQGTSRLHGVVRVASHLIFAVGSHGALLEIRGYEARQIPWARTGHLYAIAVAPGERALVVGSGGHALCVSRAKVLPGVVAPPGATLETVQTTRDLRGVAVDESGTGWALGDDGRLLERREVVWTRIPVDPRASGRLLAVYAHEGHLTVVEETGIVLEGIPSEDPPDRLSSPDDHGGMARLK